MSICWNCYWGWPKAVTDIYDQAVEKLEAIGMGDPFTLMHYGPAHVVWEDENWDLVESCIEDCDDRGAWWWKQNGGYHSPETVEIVRESLEKLLALPDEILFCEPEDYDGNNPEAFPPPPEIEWSSQGR